VTGTFPEALKQGRTAMPHQKRRAAAVGKWHSACPEVRLYRSEVSCGKDIATCWQTVYPMFESFQKAAWEGKDCYCSQGVGAGSKIDLRW